jgi:hypothetical protein
MGKTSGGARMRRRVAIPLALSLILIVVVFAALAYQILTSDDARSSSSFVGRQELASISAGKKSLSADVPIALLGDYFEHGLEHAPPRDPCGVMQKREGYYQTPQDPVSFLGGKLTGTSSDRKLSRLLGAWSDRFVQGQVSTKSQIELLEQAAGDSSINANSLLQAAQAFQFLEGDAMAVAFIRAGLTKAERQFATTRSGDQRALPLLHQLDQTKVLWKQRDYVALERRFRLARRLYPPLSIESRRAGYVLADALFYQHRFSEAEAMVMAVMAEHRRVGDLGLLDPGDWYEMMYQVGYLQFSAGDFEPAIQNLRQIQGKGEHDKDVAAALFSALLHTGRLNEAKKVRRELVRLAPRSSESLAFEQEEVSQHQEWREQMNSSRATQASISEKLPE